MNKRQRELQEINLEEEKRVLAEIEKSYEEALKTINEQIEAFKARNDLYEQSVIYRVEYQAALKVQVEAALKTLQANEFQTVSEYLNTAYQDGFIGTMYDIHGQGIPMLFPIDHEQVVQAIRNDTKLSTGLYESLGHDIKTLQRKISSEISRGLSTGKGYDEIARDIANWARIPKNNAYRIARTEAHRIQIEATSHAQYKAKEKGADIVKQWDAAMDGDTRPNHRKLDGQIRELDEPFEVGGMKVMYPGAFGDPSEDCNCRCALLQRARWALDDEELQRLKERAEYFGLDKTNDFEDFKGKYLKIPANYDTINVKTVLQKPIQSSEVHYNALLTKLNEDGVDYIPVMNHNQPITDEEIISSLSGGDKTKGSCASLGFAYIGQKQGWNVLDFRGGKSQDIFSNSFNLMYLSQADGLKVLTAEGKTSLTVGNRLLKQCEVGKEYYLSVGRHASIVRKIDDGTLQYLELQSPNESGWTNFNGNPRNTLATRFGCSSSLPSYGDFMIDINESDFGTDDFRSLLGYINTAENEQRKGLHGTIK